jgi:hypothetical protein
MVVGPQLDQRAQEDEPGEPKQESTVSCDNCFGVHSVTK